MDPERVSLERRVHDLKQELDAKSLMRAKAEEKAKFIKAQQEDVACMIKDIHQEQMMVLVADTICSVKTSTIPSAPGPSPSTDVLDHASDILLLRLQNHHLLFRLHEPFAPERHAPGRS